MCEQQVLTIETLDDFIIEEIARFLRDHDSLAFLARLAQTSKRMNKICARLIGEYYKEREVFSVFDFSRREWRNEKGQLHRYRDKPAWEYECGTRGWSKNGKDHREFDKPAVIFTEGGMMWLKNGQPHRGGNLPAIIRGDGTREWWTDGRIHRDGNPPAIIRSDGTREWWTDGRMYKCLGWYSSVLPPSWVRHTYTS